MYTNKYEMKKTLKNCLGFYNYAVEQYDNEKYLFQGEDISFIMVFILKNNLPMCFFKNTESTGERILGVNGSDYMAIDSIHTRDNELELYNTNLYTEIKDVLDNITNTNTFGISDIIHNYTKKCYTVELTSINDIVFTKKVSNFPSRCLADVVIPIRDCNYSNIILTVKDGDKIIDCDYVGKYCLWRFDPSDVRHPIVSDIFCCYDGVFYSRNNEKINAIKRKLI